MHMLPLYEALYMVLFTDYVRVHCQRVGAASQSQLTGTTAYN
jgi:hypothetical protein